MSIRRRKKIYFIGDVHGRVRRYLDTIDNLDSCSIQVGDMGVGMGLSNNHIHIPPMPQHKFIRGNHDNPEVCRNHPNYLGEYGYLEKPDIYYISGAFSIDKDHRIPGLSWWDDEELGIEQLQEIIDTVPTIAPRIIVSHDAPKGIHRAINAYRYENPAWRNRTDLALEHLFGLYSPEYWIFGHHHTNAEVEVKGTRFICLNELNVYEIEGVEF